MAIKIDITQKMVDLNGDEIPARVQSRCPECGHVRDAQSLTLRTILVNALTNTEQGEKLPGSEQYKRYRMARRIHDRDVIEFTTQEAAELQERVAKFYAPLVTGQVWEILEGKGDTDDESTE